MRFWTEKRILWGMIFAYILIFGIFTAVRHYNFQTQAWDLAIFAQSLWNTLDGKILHNNLEEAGNTLGVHMSPILFLLVPAYAIFPTPYLLLFVQTLALALGAWPLYLAALHRLQDKKLALIIAAGYLLYPSLHWANIYDFHPVTFTIPLLLASFYFFETKQWKLLYIFLALAASAREDSILIVMCFGLYITIQAFLKNNRSEIKKGALIAAIALIYFLLAIKLIMPALGGGLLRIDRYAQLGKTPAEILLNIPAALFNIEKIKYLFWLFLPVAFLPLIAWESLLLIMPGILENLLTNYQSQFSGIYHYDSVLIAGVFISAILALQKLIPKFKNKNYKIALLAVIIIGYLFRSPLNPVFFPIELFQKNPRWEIFRSMVKIVPPRVSVAAHTNLVPHLSNREHAYMLGREPFPPDIILIDGADGFGFKDKEEFQKYVDNYINSGLYDIQGIENRYLILKKK